MNIESCHKCEPTYDILKVQFRNGDIVVPFDCDKPCEIARLSYYCGDAFAFTKEHTQVKIYDKETGRLAPVVGFGVDSDKEHEEHTKRFLGGWKNSGFLTPREYLNSLA